ncbi:MAG: ASCH domain-containing protein [Candidatus Faecousia sp.]|nr:ASCH domain-containing protein [Candidatus Faecousia sp.]
MLTLPIKKQWFDMILSGEKKEEYREIKPYYEKRFANAIMEKGAMLESGGRLNEWLLTDVIFSLPIKFRNGYAAKSPCFVADCRLKIGTGKPEWGAIPGQMYYVLQIHSFKEEGDGEDG